MTNEPAQYWIGSASHDHVLRGVEGGFCQLSHGRPEALRRMRKGCVEPVIVSRERAPGVRFSSVPH